MEPFLPSGATSMMIESRGWRTFSLSCWSMSFPCPPNTPARDVLPLHPRRFMTALPPHQMIMLGPTAPRFKMSESAQAATSTNVTSVRRYPTCDSPTVSGQHCNSPASMNRHMRKKMSTAPFSFPPSPP